MAENYYFTLLIYCLAGKLIRFTVCVFKANLQVEILGSPAIHCSFSKLQLDHITSHPRRQYFNIGISLTFIFSVQNEKKIWFVCV